MIDRCLVGVVVTALGWRPGPDPAPTAPPSPPLMTGASATRPILTRHPADLGADRRREQPEGLRPRWVSLMDQRRGLRMALTSRGRAKSWRAVTTAFPCVSKVGSASRWEFLPTPTVRLKGSSV